MEKRELKNADEGQQFKGSPAPDKGQALESGEPTLAGMSQGHPIDDNGEVEEMDFTNAAPEEGEHWESGRHHAL